MVRLSRRAPLKRRRRRTAPARKPRRWLLGAAVLLALALLWWRQPEDPPPRQPDRTVPVRAAALPAVAPARHRHLPPPAKRDLPERAALAAAFRERSAALKACALPGEAARLPMRLHVGRSGVMKGLDFTGDPPSPRLAACVRKTAMAWSFDGLHLPGDVELLVAVSFTTAG